MGVFVKAQYAVGGLYELSVLSNTQYASLIRNTGTLEI